LELDKIICGDALKVLPTLPRATMIFADPPDNLGLKYRGFVDRQDNYREWLAAVMVQAVTKSEIVWLSHYHTYMFDVAKWAATLNKHFEHRFFFWRFTFGQHRQTDCGNGYRPILRIMEKGARLYPNAIRVPSARQLKYNDKRANPKGRVPDDVWEFSRVCGTFHERRKWHPNQHPEALIERIVKFSCKPGDLVIDMFAGTGTVNRVCRRLGINCIGIEISKFYCEQIKKEQYALIE
jgi:site-specific DNA-methyltransferase (adenine-specific)